MASEFTSKVEQYAIYTNVMDGTVPKIFKIGQKI